MSAVTIIFLDIVGFSKYPNSRQRELVDSLTTEVTSSLSPLINPPPETPHIVAMPTGDGMALAFIHKPNQPWDISTIMSLIYRVQQWAKSKDISIRTGIHSGEVDVITDINNKTNIVGDTINYAQRVMDAANPKQVLFSDVAFRQYIGSNNPSYSSPPYSPDCKAVFEGSFDVQAKHGMRMLVYKMTLEPPQEWLSNDDPVSQNPIIMEPTPPSLPGRRTRLVAVAGVLAVVLVAGIAGTIFLLGRQDRSELATLSTEPSASLATTKIATKFDVSYGTANASGWKWGVAEITTGTQELIRDTETHIYPWVFYVLRGSTEIGTANGEKVIPAGEAAFLPARQSHTHRYPPESQVLIFRPSDRPFGNFHDGNRLWESDAPVPVNAGQNYSVRVREYTLAPGVANLTVKGQWGYIKEGTLTIRTNGAAGALQAGRVFSLNSEASQVLGNEGAAPVRFIVVDLY